MHVSGIYIALAALIVLVVSIRVVVRRLALRVGIGDGDDRELRKRIRVQANAIEYLPIALLLLVALEWNQTRPDILHVCGITLIVARVAHAIGLSLSSGASPGRLAGITLTFLVMLALALLLLWQQIVR